MQFPCQPISLLSECKSQESTRHCHWIPKFCLFCGDPVYTLSGIRLTTCVAWIPGQTIFCQVVSWPFSQSHLDCGLKHQSVSTGLRKKPCALFILIFIECPLIFIETNRTICFEMHKMPSEMHRENLCFIEYAPIFVRCQVRQKQASCLIK